MSGATAEIIEVCEALPADKRMEVFDFARFLLLQQDDARWEKLLSEERPRARLDDFLKASAAEGDESFDLTKL